MATGVYEWKTNVPKLPGVNGGTVNPAADPMAAAAPKPEGGTLGTSSSGMDFGSMLKSSPAASQPTASFNDLFQGVGDQRQQNVQAATQNIAQGFQPQGPSTSGQQARNEFLKSQDETQRQVLEQSALAGRGDTGQLVGDNRNFLTQQAQPARMDFEAQLQSQEEGQARQRSQDAFGNLLGLEGLGEQSRSTEAQNALTARGQDITVRGQDLQSQQAQAGIESQERMQGKDITSREKLGFADLSVREKELAQQGSQFKDELAFKKYATDGGWSQQEADRAWKSMESDKDRSTTVSESALDRELEKYLGDAGLDIDRQKLTETIRQFDGKLAFDQWATQAGLDDNEKARVWDGHLQDLNQKWQTGERLGSEEQQVLIEDKRIQANTAAQEFERVAGLEVLGKTQDWERAQAEILNGYQVSRDQGQMSHEDAMQVAKLDMEKRLTEMGLDAEAARQAADISARQWEVERELGQQETLANAELLYKYDSLRQQAGISEKELALKQEEVRNQATQFAEALGLDTRKFNETIALEKNQAELDKQAMLLELAGDDPDMVEFASLNFVNTMKGMGLISPEEAASMQEDIKGSTKRDADKVAEMKDAIRKNPWLAMSGVF